MCQNEPRLLIVFLLVDDPVQTDCPALEARECGVPDFDAVAASTMRRGHDVEAYEAKRTPVFYHRDRRDRLVTEQADQEAAWICRIETIRIV